MRVLALDAATEACSVALLTGDQLIERSAELGKSHAQNILAMVDSVLVEAQVSLTLLDGIAASVGPGAFTGVRISVSVAQGLAFGANLRVIPITTLEALASQAVEDGATHALACLDARMGEVYWGCFAVDTVQGVSATSAARVGAPESVKLPYSALARAAVAYRGIGRGFAAYPALAAMAGVDLRAADRNALPHARDIARLGALRLSAGQGLDPAQLLPTYLRDKVALTEAERRQAKGA